VTFGPESVRTIPPRASRPSAFHSFAYPASTPLLSGSELSANGFRLKTFQPPLTPAVSTLARPSLNLFPCYILPATGGRVPLVLPRLTARPARLKRRPLQKQGAGWALRSDSGQASPSPTGLAGHGARLTCCSSPVTRYQSLLTSRPLSVTSRQYCAPIARDAAKTEPRGIPAWSGSPRCGYVPFANRCPDAHD
jgi:hypothetical protein